MSNSPGPLNKQNLSKATLVGTSLAVGGIVLFLVLWSALGQAQVNNAARLFASMCIPPAIISVLVGGYFLFGRKNKSN